MHRAFIQEMPVHWELNVQEFKEELGEQISGMTSQDIDRFIRGE